MNPLIEALEPRARLCAEILGNRLPDSGQFKGYTRDEPLKGVLVRANTIEWNREHYSPDHAGMTFGFLSARGINSEPVGTDRVIASNVIERKEDLIVFKKAIEYEETISHTFSRTRTVEEATEEAWEVSAKASLTLAYGGVTGLLEAAAKYGQKLNRKTTDTETVQDTVTKRIKVVGPVEIRWVAERSTDTLLREYDAVPDLDFKLYFVTDNSAWEWASFADVFIAAANGEAPVDQSYSIFASSSPSHDVFEQHPVPESDIIELRKPLAKPVRFSAEYQTINRQSIKAL